MFRLLLFLLLLTIIAINCRHRSAFAPPVETMELSDSLKGISGLIYWDDRLWAHNDRDDRNMYSLDPFDGSILESYSLEPVYQTRHEWEDISQDEDFIYIGDMGNNSRGNRRDLHILRIEKVAISRGEIVVDTIFFAYSDQENFHPIFPNTTRFDCEALLVTQDSIYLFTKHWIGGKTSVYSLSKSPGSHKALHRSTHHVGGMITGATFNEKKRTVILCGYTTLMQPFLMVLSNFSENNFFSGNRLKIKLDLPFHQVEGITTNKGNRYFISNERSYLPKVHEFQKIHIVDLQRYMD
ncbi:MAG: hypothetical protein JW861_11700 [Bacteroidales bacterium]|nr:hypothetical protein [Bacteroidales bacterium]